MYSYTPLPDRHIRLLRLYPGEYAEDICVELISVESGSNGSQNYHALSYTWGSNVLDHKVTVVSGESQQTLPIAENAHTALRHIRHSTSVQSLWVDAICINQQDVEERNDQVARMADIYKSAEKVIIWLGPEENNSRLAIEGLQLLSSKIEIHWPTRTISAASSAEDGTQWLDMKQPAPFDKVLNTALLSLLHRAWFSRLWVLQEVFLAGNRAEVLCGEKTMPWESLRKAVYCLRMRPTSRGVRRALLNAWRSCHLSSPTSLKSALDDTSFSQCSDQRDRIFGVLHLVEEERRLGIQVDYKKSVFDVFRDVLLRAIRLRGDATLLNSCEVKSSAEDIPSWIPNWSTPRICGSIPYSRGCANSRPQVLYQDDKALTLTGICPMRIKKCISILPQEYTNSDLVDTELDSTSELCTSLRRLTGLIGGNLLLPIREQVELLCRTLAVGVFSDHFEPIDPKSLDFQDTVDAVLKLTLSTTDDFPYVRTKVLRVFEYNVLGRVLVITMDNSSVGLAPQACREGDWIVVLLGCQSPMVLRPNQDGSFIVIGECYVHEIMSGEALLGPLPGNWRRVIRYYETFQGSGHAYINREMGICQKEDPRLGPLPEGWCELEHPHQQRYALFRRKDTDQPATLFDPRMSPEALHKRGVELREFRLV